LTDAAASHVLRVAVVVDSELPPRWAAALIALLEKSRRFDVVVIRTDAKPVRSAGGAFRLYEWLDGRLFRTPNDALARVPVPVPTSPPSREPEPCDVVIDTVDARAESPSTRPQYGVWVLAHTDAHGRRREPWLFWEMHEREVHATRLEAHLADGQRRLLYSSYGASDLASLHRARQRACSKAQGAIFDRLVSVHDRGASYLHSRPTVGGDADADRRRPSVAIVVWHAGRAVQGVLARRLRRVFGQKGWFIASRHRVPASPDTLVSTAAQPFVPIRKRRREVFADPFPFEHDGRTYLLFENYDRRARKGVISSLLLDTSAQATGPPTVALERAYHLSYPFVFRHRDGIFMIPESADNRTVELYRALDFPSAWTLERVLLDDIRAFDATLLEAFDRLWLFAAVAEPGGSPNDELHLYSASDLCGPWEPHPENPVVADVRSARPAGRLFRHDGHWIRPAQDCSRAYGFAIVFNRIEVLTRHEYGETAIARIDPDWLPGIFATHTYNFTDTVEAIDAARTVSRFPLRRRSRPLP
jgi:hypothetical protein